MTQDDDGGVDKLGKKGGQTGEDFENELQSSVSAFEALERDFQEVCVVGISSCRRILERALCSSLL